VLNQASTIEACILSVAKQNVNVEHIIIDGGSTDGTIDIIKKHEAKLAFWVSEKDSGQSEAINKGLKRAAGTWFNWLNADDQLTENALQSVLETADESTKVVVGKCAHINLQGEVLEVGSARIWHRLEATLGNYSMGQPSVFYRSEIVKELGGLNEQLHLCLDMDLWFRFLLHFGQQDIRSTEKILSRFLVHENAKSAALKTEMRAEKYGIYRALFQQPLPDIVSKFFAEYPIPSVVKYRISGINQTELLSYFAWHLMVEAYEKKDIRVCQNYFEVVNKEGTLSQADKLLWKARIASAKILQR
jgi:glycosyltransferase involved in cell wall biosynthesis